MFAPSEVLTFGSFVIFMSVILYLLRRFSRAVDKAQEGDDETEKSIHLRYLPPISEI